MDQGLCPQKAVLTTKKKQPPKPSQSKRLRRMAQSHISEPSGFRIIEKDQTGNLIATYVASPTNAGKTERIDVVKPTTLHNYLDTLMSAFLPAGYPQSVTKDYLEYQIYDSLQAFSSSIAGLISSRAVLEGIGVGDASASATSAIILSVLQDSVGRIATILFAHRLGTSLEPECKMYRLAADVFNDAAMILDCLSPIFPKAIRVAVLSLSSVLRALCGVAAGSAKASLSAHFATKGNLGEVNAKDSSQETVISLLGMLAGSLIVPYIKTPATTWLALIALLAIHLGMNYLAVRAVCMRTLNRQRAGIVFSHYVSALALPSQSERVDTATAVHVLAPEFVSAFERIFDSDGAIRWQGRGILGHVALGVPLSAILTTIHTTHNSRTGSYGASSDSGDSSIKVGASLREVLHVFRREDYILWYMIDQKRFLVALKWGAGEETMLKAWLHAVVIVGRYGVTEEGGKGNGKGLLWTLEGTLNEVNSFWEGLRTALVEKGWDLDTGAMETTRGTRVVIEEEDENRHSVGKEE